MAEKRNSKEAQESNVRIHFIDGNDPALASFIALLQNFRGFQANCDPKELAEWDKRGNDVGKAIWHSEQLSDLNFAEKIVMVMGMVQTLAYENFIWETQGCGDPKCTDCKERLARQPKMESNVGGDVELATMPEDMFKR